MLMTALGTLDFVLMRKLSVIAEGEKKKQKPQRIVHHADKRVPQQTHIFFDEVFKGEISLRQQKVPFEELLVDSAFLPQRGFKLFWDPNIEHIELKNRDKCIFFELYVIIKTVTRSVNLQKLVVFSGEFPSFILRTDPLILQNTETQNVRREEVLTRIVFPHSACCTSVCRLSSVTSAPRFSRFSLRRERGERHSHAVVLSRLVKKSWDTLLKNGFGFGIASLLHELKPKNMKFRNLKRETFLFGDRVLCHLNK